MSYDKIKHTMDGRTFGMASSGRVDELTIGRPTEAFPPPSQLFVPVTARGTTILDNGGDRVAECFTPELAQRIADLLNGDAREFKAGK